MWTHQGGQGDEIRGIKAPMDAASLLLAGLLSWHPGLDPEVGREHIAAAQAAEDGEVDAALLLALAWFEAGWEQQALAYTECKPEKKCRRTKHRRYPHPRAPQHGRTPFFCGTLQHGTRSWTRCRELLTDLDESYRTAVASLQGWERHCARKGRTECTLRGYHGGFRYLKRTSDGYPRRVLTLAERLRQRMRVAWNSARATASSMN